MTLLGLEIEQKRAASKYRQENGDLQQVNRLAGLTGLLAAPASCASGLTWLLNVTMKVEMFCRLIRDKVNSVPIFFGLKSY